MLGGFQGQEGVAAALAACKILREMSHLETEAEVVRLMKEAKYEQLAVGKLHMPCRTVKVWLAAWQKTPIIWLVEEIITSASDGDQSPTPLKFI